MRKKTKPVISLTEEEKELVISHFDYIKKVVDMNVKFVPNEALWTIEDAYQIGFLAACEAAKEYNPEKASFKSFVTRCIKSKLRLLFIDTQKIIKIFDYDIRIGDNMLWGITSKESFKKNFSLDYFKCENLIEKCFEDYKKTETTFELGFEVRQIMASPKYTKMQKECVSIAYRNSTGYTLTELGKEYNITKQAVSARKELGLKILENRLDDAV